MENLQHDPRTKQQIKEMLYAYLYQPVEKEFKNRIEILITRNALINRDSHRSFVYKGEFYSCDTQRPPRKANRLAAQLKPEMDKYLNDLKNLNSYEVPRILGFLNQVLNSSNGLSDYLRVLPESLHQPLQAMIATCPCRACVLSEEAVKQLVENNEESITLLKQRLTTNLLI